MKIILGSSSKFRQRVFSKVTPDFTSLAPDFDEKSIRDPDSKQLTIKLAHAKADSLVLQVHEPSLLVTADQVVVINGEIREKPIDEEQARAFLRSYNEQPVQVVNGVVVTNTQTGKRVGGNDVVNLHFKTIPEEIINQLIAEGEVLHCGGALKAEHPALQPYLLERQGSDESLQGVPIELIKQLIEAVEK